jgi:hypothetical protein
MTVVGVVGTRSFRTDHAGVLLVLAHDPGVRLLDIGAGPGRCERTGYGIVVDITQTGADLVREHVR